MKSFEDRLVDLIADELDGIENPDMVDMLADLEHITESFKLFVKERLITN